jgi:hypothetical protein
VLSNQLAVVVQVPADVSPLGQGRSLGVIELRGEQHLLALPALELPVFSGEQKRLDMPFELRNCRPVILRRKVAATSRSSESGVCM